VRIETEQEGRSRATSPIWLLDFKMLALALTFWEKGGHGQKKTRNGLRPMERKMAGNQMTAGGDALGHPDMDYAAHLATYKFFTNLLKWGTATVIIAVILLAFLTL
jgi:hypothetical protein